MTQAETKKSCTALDEAEGESAQKVAQALADVYDADLKSLPAPPGRSATPTHGRSTTPCSVAGDNDGASRADSGAAAAAAMVATTDTAADAAAADGNGGAAADTAAQEAAAAPAPPPVAKGFGGAMSAFKRLRQKAKQTIQDTVSDNSAPPPPPLSLYPSHPLTHFVFGYLADTDEVHPPCSSLESAASYRL